MHVEMMKNVWKNKYNVAGSILVFEEQGLDLTFDLGRGSIRAGATGVETVHLHRVFGAI